MREESTKKEANRHLTNSLKLLNEELDKKTQELIELKSIYAKTKKSLDNRVRYYLFLSTIKFWFSNPIHMYCKKQTNYFPL